MSTFHLDYGDYKGAAQDWISVVHLGVNRGDDPFLEAGVFWDIGSQSLSSLYSDVGLKEIDQPALIAFYALCHNLGRLYNNETSDNLRTVFTETEGERGNDPASD